MAKQSTVYPVRLDADLSRKALKLAKADGRTLANLIRLLLLRYITEKDGD